jgi:hypothetical protein
MVKFTKTHSWIEQEIEEKTQEPELVQEIFSKLALDEINPSPI